MSEKIFKDGSRTLTAKEVIEDLLYVDPYSGGLVEQMESKLKLIEEMLVLAFSECLSVQDANLLAGYDRFTEDEDEI
jgi:hypothetical protein